MIDKANAVETLLGRLKKLPLGHGLDMRTFKRDRGALFVRQGEDSFLVVQDGFEQQRHDNVPLGKMKKLIKGLLKKEFPRSTKIRLYALGECPPDGASGGASGGSPGDSA